MDEHKGYLKSTKELQELVRKLQDRIMVTDHYGIKCHLEAPEIVAGEPIKLKGTFIVFYDV